MGAKDHELDAQPAKTILKTQTRSEKRSRPDLLTYYFIVLTDDKEEAEGRRTTLLNTGGEKPRHHQSLHSRAASAKVSLAASPSLAYAARAPRTDH